MSRDPYPDDDPGEPPEPTGRMRLSSPRLVAGWALAGLVLGWVLRPLAIWLDLRAPRVPWAQTAPWYLVAAILAVLAWTTHRALQQRRAGLRPHEAVNRLLIAKSCVLVGALALGGYLGYALAWVGGDSELAGQRIVRSLVAALGALLTVVTALLLERACRVRKDDASSR